MKRHKSLIGLSHDHHHGLLLAQLIKKGAPTYKNLPQNTEEKVLYTKDRWENELKYHFENEENILFPFVKDKDDELDKLIIEIVSEHFKIKKLILDLDNSLDKDETLNSLGILLESHIRKEERKLFPLIESVFKMDLDNLEGKINSVKDSCKTK